LIKSKNGTNYYEVIENDGKIYIKNVKLSENENKELRNNFKL
jgi:hypothetical protein